MRPLSFFVAALVAASAAQPSIKSAAPTEDEDPAYSLSFPEDFLFSSATASYQVEGAWNVSGKGENVWDRTTHEHPELVLDRSNGDVACDSYHKYKEDIQLAKSLGTKLYRFSLSWSRILPTGAIDKINPDGIRYYNDLINECLANNIEPMVTIFHWDLPQPLQDLGGFPNDIIADYFVDYANLVFKSFGDRVKWWLTFNEPLSMCSEGYGVASKAPAIQMPAQADYLCAHTILKAHGRAYHLYKTTYGETHKGKIGFAGNSDYYFPKDPSNEKDVQAADRYQQFDLGWFLHPVFGKDGDYPKIMRQYVDDACQREGIRSRLPTFTPDEVTMIKGSADFLAINCYTSSLVADSPSALNLSLPLSRPRDAGVEISNDPNWEVGIAAWLKTVPEGFRGMLNWLKKEYDNPEVIITENGFADGGEIRDVGRVSYYRRYLLELLKAIHNDGCKVTGYTAWSLIDNYEWFYGYAHKFGLHHVDFTDPNRPRKPKMSAEFFKRLIATRKVPKDGTIDFPEDETSGGSPGSARGSVLVAACTLLMLAIARLA